MAPFCESVYGMWARLGRRWRITAAAGFVLLLPGSSVAGQQLAPGAVATLASAGHVDLAALLQDTARAGRGLPRFSHGDHRRQSCASCHSSRLRHGALRVRSAADCRRCHHAGPGSDQCATCH